tara:strand:+ start:76 stop:240 length:165 start_codon:yes stop_codon:yes gene_type:complete
MKILVDKLKKIAIKYGNDPIAKDLTDQTLFVQHVNTWWESRNSKLRQLNRGKMI